MTTAHGGAMVGTDRCGVRCAARLLVVLAFVLGAAPPGWAADTAEDLSAEAQVGAPADAQGTTVPVPVDDAERPSQVRAAASGAGTEAVGIAGSTVVSALLLAVLASPVAAFVASTAALFTVAGVFETCGVPGIAFCFVPLCNGAMPVLCALGGTLGALVGGVVGWTLIGPVARRRVPLLPYLLATWLPAIAGNAAGCLLGLLTLPWALFLWALTTRG